MTMLGALATPSRAQEDTTATSLVLTPNDHSPRGALIRAAILPGWGQIYNRQYYKLPFVYAGLGGFVYGVLYTNDRVRYYRRAYLYRAWEDLQPDDNPYEHYIGTYNDLVEQLGFEIDAEPLKNQRNKFKRNRDLFVLGVGLFYGLTMLDAFVSAHLRDFDVGEDLTLRVAPGGGLAPQSNPTLTIRWRF